MRETHSVQLFFHYIPSIVEWECYYCTFDCAISALLFVSTLPTRTGRFGKTICVQFIGGDTVGEELSEVARRTAEASWWKQAIDRSRRACRVRQIYRGFCFFEPAPEQHSHGCFGYGLSPEDFIRSLDFIKQGPQILAAKF